MVGVGVGLPAHLTEVAIIARIVDAVVVVILIAEVAKSVSVVVFLIGVGKLWAVVNPVENAVQIQIGFIHPHADINLVSLVKHMGSVHAVVVGGESNNRGPAGRERQI